MTENKTPQENLITRINYSPQIKGALGSLIFGIPALAFERLDRGNYAQNLPNFMRGRLFDSMSVPVTASMNKIFMGDKFEVNLISGIIVSCAIEIGEGLHFWAGTFDLGDFLAYGVGAVIWTAFEESAKSLHDSGATLPIYKAMGIKHRKFN